MIQFQWLIRHKHLCNIAILLHLVGDWQVSMAHSP